MTIPWHKLLPYMGWPLCGVMVWLYLGVRDDLAAEIERCNTDKMTSIAEAERVAREGVQSAWDKEREEVERRMEALTQARLIVDEALRTAANREPEIRRVVEKVRDEDACIDTVVPSAIVERLRQ